MSNENKPGAIEFSQDAYPVFAYPMLANGKRSEGFKAYLNPKFPGHYMIATYVEPIGDTNFERVSDRDMDRWCDLGGQRGPGQ